MAAKPLISPLMPVPQQPDIDTLKELGSSIRRTTTERVQFSTQCELVTETKVGKFDVLIAIHQQILGLQVHTIIRCNGTCSTVCEMCHISSLLLYKLLAHLYSRFTILANITAP